MNNNMAQETCGLQQYKLLERALQLHIQQWTRIIKYSVCTLVDVHNRVSAIFSLIWDYFKAYAIYEVSTKVECLDYAGIIQSCLGLRITIPYGWCFSSLNGFLNLGMLRISGWVMLLGSSVSKCVILLLGSQAGSLLEETVTTTEHVTMALWQRFLPSFSHLSPACLQQCSAGYPPCGHRGARLSLVVEKEQGDMREGGWGSGGGEKRRSSAAMRNEQPQICSGCTVNSGSDCSGLTAPAEVGRIWASSVFVLPMPCRNNSKEPGGLLLVYPDSCSKACHHSEVPVWIAALFVEVGADAGLLSSRVQ